MPPTNLSVRLSAFPPHHPDQGARRYDEAATPAVLNQTATEAGIDPLPGFAALYDVDLSLVTSFGFLDHYRNHRPAAKRTAPLVPAASTLAGQGDEGFVYFSTARMQAPALSDALVALPLPRRGDLSNASVEAKVQLAAIACEVARKLGRDNPADPLSALAARLAPELATAIRALP